MGLPIRIISPPYAGNFAGAKIGQNFILQKFFAHFFVHIYLLVRQLIDFQHTGYCCIFHHRVRIPMLWQQHYPRAAYIRALPFDNSSA